MRELQQVEYRLLGTGFVLKVVGVKQEGTWEAVSWPCPASVRELLCARLSTLPVLPQ